MLLRLLFCHELKGLYLGRRRHCNSSGKITATTFLKHDGSGITATTFFRGDGLVEQVLRFELVGTNLNLRSPNLHRHVGATIVVGLQHYVGK
jgi:hypothetical protein